MGNRDMDTHLHKIGKVSTLGPLTLSYAYAAQNKDSRVYFERVLRTAKYFTATNGANEKTPR